MVSQLPRRIPQAFRPLDTPNACGKVGLSKPLSDRLISEPTYHGQPEIDRRWGKTPSLQLVPIAKNNSSSKGKPWLGAVPGDEILDRSPVGTLGSGGTQTLKNRAIGMIEVR